MTTGFRITGRDLRAKRERLGLSVPAFAIALEMGADGARDLRHMEAQTDASIPGPLGLAVQALADGWRPPHMRGGPALVSDQESAAA